MSRARLENIVMAITVAAIVVMTGILAYWWHEDDVDGPVNYRIEIRPTIEHVGATFYEV